MASRMASLASRVWWDIQEPQRKLPSRISQGGIFDSPLQPLISAPTFLFSS
jgi:hypothetical protein